MRAKVTLLGADGQELSIDIEDGFTVSDVFEAAGRYLAGGKLSVSGAPATPDTPVEEGDIIAEHRTAEGNY